LERIKEILTNPVTAILKAKKEKNLNKTLSILILSWILVGISFFLAFYKTALILVAFGSALAVFLFGILFSIFYSYVIDIVMNILGGKGKYYDSLTAATYSSLPISIGILLTSILSEVHPVLGVIIGFIVIAVTTALSLSIYFRAIKEFYSTDMFMTFVGFLLILYVFMIAFYISTAFSISSMLFGSLLPNFGV
jgi:O-antigen/teichoic acid export membrane protein